MRIIRGKYGRRRFDVPTNITARPTTDFARENVFNIIENIRDIEGARCLDLFAGTGAVSFEFLSRGAAAVTAVEKSPVQARFIAKVAAELHDTNLHLVRGDVFRFIRDASMAYDIIFVDPPYNLPDFDTIAPAILGSPLFGESTLLVMEHSRERDYTALSHFQRHKAYGSVNFSLFYRE